MLEPSTLILASVIIFCGAVTQSLIGFGLAVIASPLFYIIEPSLVPVPVIIMGFSIASLTLYREQSQLELSGLKYALIGRLPGGIIGSLLILLAPQAVLGLAIASIVALSVLLTALKCSIPINRTNLFIAGTISGMFSNIAAIGGPPMAILLSGKDPAQFRAALSAFFFVSAIIALIILGLSGLVHLEHLWVSLMLLPSALLGYVVAGRLVGRINKQKTTVLTLVLCSGCALLLAVKSIIELC
ncbi:sulfite exporter TauE/SafE family protein [Shewanella youngdeokensis]|uniref:Probable membrane transporter protein n=1 Tax=Shewanella youngdeokensis TaxID=2999068 RepID=A0ABZ0K1A4_9GAMM|nr:sulfite exporter TauE/SafE family protein [Shewanella sp. DAU334]